MDELRELINIQNNDQSLIVVLLNLGYCFILSFIVREFFLRYSSSLVAHNHIGNIIPILSCVVFLVILVVKSSIALSLGLVGALSIVRFRTPIKEPEELVFLFFAIAIGLGFGAGQSVLTSSVTVISLIIFYFTVGLKKKRSGAGFNEFNLSVNWKINECSSENIIAELADFCANYKLIKMTVEGETAALLVQFERIGNISTDMIIKSIRSKAPSASLSIYEQQVNW